MTTYKTGNPIGSTAVKDLYDNAENLDVSLNGDSNTWVDRLGRTRKSWAQIEDSIESVKANADTQVKKITSETDKQIANVTQEANSMIASLGYQVPVPYAAGIELTQATQTVEYDGEVYAPVMNQLPFITSGIFEAAKFRLIQGVTGIVFNDFKQGVEKGRVHSISYTTKQSARRGGLNAHSLHLTVEKIRPTVTFIDDDGHGLFLSRLKPIYESKNIKCGLAITTTYPDSPDYTSYMSWSQIKELHDGGYEILSHHHSRNFDGISDQDAEFELSQSRYELESRGIDVESIVYIQGYRGSASVRSLVREYYRAGFRTVDGGIQPVPLEDFTVRRFNAVNPTVESNPTLEEMKNLVDYAEANNEWVVFATHAHYAGMTVAHQQVISDLIDYIQSKNIDILTPSEALDIHGSKFFAGTVSDESMSLIPQNDFFKIDKRGKPYPAGARVISGVGFDQNSPITDYAINEISVFRPASGDDWPLVSGSATAVVETYRIYYAGEFGFQRITQERTGETCHRAWDRTSSSWGEWIYSAEALYRGVVTDGTKPITDYKKDHLTIERVHSGATGFPGTSTAQGMLMTVCGSFSSTQNVGHQVYTRNKTGSQYTRTWNYDENKWNEWVQELQLVKSSPETANNGPGLLVPAIRIIAFSSTDAITHGMPGAGTLISYSSAGSPWATYQIFHSADKNKTFIRYYNGSAGAWTDWVANTGGATGSFTSQDGKTVTVENGVIVSIS